VLDSAAPAPRLVGTGCFEDVHAEEFVRMDGTYGI
jgi:hypothetical protein